MKSLKFNFTAIAIILAIITFDACKTKKLAQKKPPIDTAKNVAVVTAPPKPVQPAQPVQPQVAPTEKPNYSFDNIQFDFNSAVLKTGSYPILDKAASAMKADPSVKFILKGYASIEGTEEHNMILSEDRANSVKAYLINSGVSSANLSTKGYGTSNPVGDNNTEAGRELNRRVEMSPISSPTNI